MSRFGLFCVGGLDYAVPLFRMLRIDQHVHSFQLPKLPQGVDSVLVDGKRLVPMLNLEEVLGRNADCSTEYAVLVESEYGTVALPADDTCGIIAEKKGRARYPADLKASAKAGVFDYLQKTFVILDIDFLTMSLTQALH